MQTWLTHVLPVALLALWCPVANAQWLARVEVGADRFWGGSVEDSEEHRSFRPYRPTTFTAGIERRGQRLGLGLHLHYAEAAIALEGSEAVVAVNGVFGIYGVSPELAYSLSRLGPGNQLRLHAGPLFEVWTVSGEDARVRLGAQGAVSLDIPLGGRFAGSIQAGAALTSSPFNEGELESPYERRPLWRRRFGVGLDYRL